MKKRGVACALAFAALAAALGGPACVSSEDRCLPGYRYVEAYKACTPNADGGADASSDASATTDASPGTEDGGDATSSGLGNTCNGDPDCAGTKASYCLKSPLAPTDPGICSIPQCTPSDCGAAYSCCDCSAAAVPELQAWPHGVCVPREDATTVQSFGCVCP